MQLIIPFLLHFWIIPAFFFWIPSSQTLRLFRRISDPFQLSFISRFHFTSRYHSVFSTFSWYRLTILFHSCEFHSFPREFHFFRNVSQRSLHFHFELSLTPRIFTADRANRPTPNWDPSEISHYSLSWHHHWWKPYPWFCREHHQSIPHGRFPSVKPSQISRIALKSGSFISKTSQKYSQSDFTNRFLMVDSFRWSLVQFQGFHSNPVLSFVLSEANEMILSLSSLMSWAIVDTLEWGLLSSLSF